MKNNFEYNFMINIWIFFLFLIKWWDKNKIFFSNTIAR